MTQKALLEFLKENLKIKIRKDIWNDIEVTLFLDGVEISKASASMGTFKNKED